MKLDRGNPNLMQKVLRVNKHSTLESFANTTGDKAQAYMRSSGVLVTPKDPNVALPPTISVWAQPVYTPPKPEYVRPGAEDFLRYKSRGL